MDNKNTDFVNGLLPYFTEEKLQKLEAFDNSMLTRSDLCNRFKLVNFGPIAEADVRFGDLTIVTGPQATGKTLFLETFKLIYDIESIFLEGMLKNQFATHKELLDYYYGENLYKIVTSNSKIAFSVVDNTKNFFASNKMITINDFLCNVKTFFETFAQMHLDYVSSLMLEPVFDTRKIAMNSFWYGLRGFDYSDLFNDQHDTSYVFYIPAQRSLALSEGRIKTSDDFINSPYVLRKFSNYLQQYVKSNHQKLLKEVIVNYDFFNKGEISMKNNAGSPRLEMKIDKQIVPYMAWSTGQRELAPLLMALEYFNLLKYKPKFLIIEEPELGLHPRAISEFMLTVLKIIQSGTKIIISTHSSTPLDFVWTIKQLKEKGAKPSELTKMFDFKIKDKTIFDNLFEKSFKTYYFAPDKKTKKIYTKDISSLDVYSEDEDIANWGGMSLSADRAGNIVSRL